MVYVTFKCQIGFQFNPIKTQLKLTKPPPAYAYKRTQIIFPRNMTHTCSLWIIGYDSKLMSHKLWLIKLRLTFPGLK